MGIDELTPWEVGYALVLFFGNRSFDEILAAVLGDDEERHPAYVEEWNERYRKGWAKFFGSQDVKTQHRFMDAVMKAYGDEARRALAMARSVFPELRR